MERLTKRLDDGQAVMDCQNCDLNSLRNCTCLDCRNRLKDRLAYYEDLEEHGRIVVLPCKVGATVWVVNSIWISEYTITSVYWDNVFFQFKAENKAYAEDCRYFSFFDERIGKTVFLTREEAEKALKEDAV